MSDPVADFLAREQDALAGIQDDSLETGAVQFNNGVVNNDVLDDDSGSVNEAPVLSGAGDSGVDLPALDGTLAANGPQRSSTNPSPSLNHSAPKPEPEKIKKWREEQKIMLEKKDKEEEKKMEEMRAAGRRELEEWYAQRKERLAKTRKANRKAEEDFLAERDASKDGAEWDRIAKLCEFNVKNSKTSSDLSRLRALLLQLKAQKE